MPRFSTNSLAHVHATSTHIASGPREVIAGFTTNLSFNDSTTKLRNLNRVSSDNIAFSAPINRLKNLNRTTTDSLTLADSINRLRNKARSIAEIFWMVRFDEELDDWVPGTEADRLIGRIRDITSAISLNDLINRSVNKNRAISDNLSFTHENTGVKGKLRALPEQTLSFASDVVTDITARVRGFTDNLTLTHDTNRLKGITRNVSDSISLADSNNRLRNKIKAISDSITFTDLVDRFIGRIKGYSVSLSFSAESINRARGLNRGSSDNLTFTGVIDRLTNKIRGFTDNLNFLEEITYGGAKTRGISESLGLNDVVNRLRGLNESTSDNLNFTDSTDRLRNKNKAVNGGNLTFADVIDQLKLKVKGFTDSISFSETITRTLPDKVRSLPTQELTFNHINEKLRNKIKSTSTENLSLNDSIEIKRGLNRVISDNIGITETIQAAKGVITRGITASMSFASTNEKRIIGRVKGFSDNLVFVVQIVKDIPSREVIIPIVSSLGEKFTRPELLSKALNPNYLYNSIIREKTNKYIKHKDIDLSFTNKPDSVADTGSHAEMNANRNSQMDNIKRGKNKYFG